MGVKDGCADYDSVQFIASEIAWGMSLYNACPQWSVGVYVYTCVYVNMWVYICMHIHKHICEIVCGMSLCNACPQWSVRVCVYTYVYVNMWMYIYMQIHKPMYEIICVLCLFFFVRMHAPSGRWGYMYIHI